MIKIEKLHVLTKIILLFFITYCLYLVPALTLGHAIIKIAIMTVLLVVIFNIMLTTIKKLSNLNDLKYIHSYSNIGLSIVITIFIVIILPMMTLKASNTNSVAPFGKTFVTYSPTCKYCKASHKNMNTAVLIYNIANPVKISTVNINEPTKLSQDLKSKIEYKGSVIKVEENYILSKGYTLANKETKEPIPASVSSIYSSINDIVMRK